LLASKLNATGNAASMQPFEPADVVGTAVVDVRQKDVSDGEPASSIAEKRPPAI
jgi:hypothetical protein